MSETLALPEELTIQTVAEELDKLRAASSSIDSDVEIDADALTSVDTAGIQLLLALVKDLESKGCAVTWKSVPAILQETSKVLGAVSVLKLAS